MDYLGIIRFSDLLKILNEHTDLKKGFVIDTSILFAASYPLDNFNEASEQFFEYVAELEIPLYTNVTVRSEFINNQRQIMIPEGLSDLYAKAKMELDPILLHKLKSFYASLSESRRTGKSYKFNEVQIRNWRRALLQKKNDGIDGWEKFCQDYLLGKIENIWENSCEELGIRFLSLRGQDQTFWLKRDLNWDRMSSIIGKYGIASSDAMIINLFLSSEFPGLVTADNEVVYVLEKLAPPGKCVIVPDRLQKN